MQSPHSPQSSGRQRNKVYHEVQYRQLCALHALNNIFQAPRTFTKRSLDEICTEIAPNSGVFNPHRSSFGLGCYDINVIITALSKKGYEIKWFDKRKDVSIINLENIFGVILNVPDKPKNGMYAKLLKFIPAKATFWTSQRHWIALKKVGQYYYNLDSKLDAPKSIGKEDNFLQFLNEQKSSNQVEILIVISKDVSDLGTWQHSNPHPEE